MGDAYQVAHDHFYLPVSLQELAAIALRLSQQESGLHAAVFRDQIGTGRKIAIQILEFLDRSGFTRRVGDQHRVVQPELFSGLS